MAANVSGASPKSAFCAPALVGALLCFAFANQVRGQAAAEAAGATSVSAAATSSMKAVQMPKIPGANQAGTSPASSPHLIATSSLPGPETNLRDLQAHAGKDAGKILLRATPIDAQIWVNGKIVGKTPMLLVLAPGKYNVEMRGARGETGKSSVDLLPRETRELVVKLQVLYPGHVTVQH